ncbi:hypothetical protein QC762_0039740 [Podospora pseudocomata]|uniref:Uncharacterized protein n=1 Tax=Podospora pseudocomata TaxID=2093779 RepID=A0ABR0GM64_9PEZI|nr:hypothetical protein QC762_0039740 [Podospora pseudocomata]
MHNDQYVPIFSRRPPGKIDFSLPIVRSLVSFPSVQSIPYSPESGVISVASTKPKVSHILKIQSPDSLQESQYNCRTYKLCVFLDTQDGRCD